MFKFGFNEYTKLFKKIKNNAKVCIYGTSEVAVSIKKELEKRRKDVEVLFFINTKKQGTVEGLPVYSVAELNAHKNEVDTGIVSSFTSSNFMHTILSGYRVPNILHVSEKLVKTMSMEKFKKAKKILKTKKDKKIYQMLADARINRKKFPRVEKYFLKTFNQKYNEYPLKHYLEYINKDAINVALDCGSHDAYDSIAFVGEFKNIEKVWAFEPLYNEFKKESLDIVMKNTGKIEIVDKAVWDKKETLEFMSMGVCSGVIESKPHMNSKCTVVKVETTTIDDFVAENNIKKVDFIKMDLENGEMHALKGAEKTLVAHRPQLAISIYHSDEHFYQIPLNLNNLLKDYVFRIGQYARGTSETVLYGIPKELL